MSKKFKVELNFRSGEIGINLVKGDIVKIDRDTVIINGEITKTSIVKGCPNLLATVKAGWMSKIKSTSKKANKTKVVEKKKVKEEVVEKKKVKEEIVEKKEKIEDTGMYDKEQIEINKIVEEANKKTLKELNKAEKEANKAKTNKTKTKKKTNKTKTTKRKPGRPRKVKKSE